MKLHKEDVLVTLSNLLTHPFETGILPWPKADDDILVYNAEYWNGAENIGNISAVQNFYPYSSVWQAHDVKSTSKFQDGALYDIILCGLPKQKEASFYQLALSLKALNDDGLLIAMAANDAGGKRLEKWFKDFGLTPSSLSKSKCRIVWAYKKDINAAAVEKFTVEGSKQVKSISGTEIVTQPGIFGWDKIDKGSQLLSQFLPKELSGIGADFGCGYGFLSNYVLENCSKIKKLYAVDADCNALVCAQENLNNYDNVDYKWTDLTQSVNLKQSLNFVIMNPPFHAGKKIDSDIGQKFIENSADCLKKNGTLYMVANAHLPYEKLLEKLFSSVEKLSEEQGFKIYKAIK
jgi:16S rRNA (guanine1207-N2)-methyltransferase